MAQMMRIRELILTINTSPIDDWYGGEESEARRIEMPP